MLPTPAHHQDYEYAQELQPCHCNLHNKGRIENPVKAQPHIQLQSLQHLTYYGFVMAFQFILETKFSCVQIHCSVQTEQVKYQGGISKFTVKGLGYFNHILWSPQLHSFQVHDM